MRRLPRLYTGAGYACFVGRAEAGRHNAHRATELEATAGYDPCEPGYATFIEALGEVYCGDLDRYVELTGAVGGAPGAARGYGLAAYVDGLQSAGRVDEALALAEEAVAAARELGNPYWISYTLWIVGMAFSKVDAGRALAAWDEGVEFVREHRVQFFEGFIGRDAARLHTSDGEPEAAWCCSAEPSRRSTGPATSRSSIITLASVPRSSSASGASSAATLLGAFARAVERPPRPELVDLGDASPRNSASEAARARCRRGGLDLNEAAAYASEQIDAARRDPAHGPASRAPAA